MIDIEKVKKGLETHLKSGFCDLGKKVCPYFEEEHCGNALFLDVEELLEENKALRLLLDWAIECDFGYDNFHDEYERYKDEIEKGANYTEGMIKIASCVIRRMERVGR